MIAIYLGIIIGVIGPLQSALFEDNSSVLYPFGGAAIKIAEPVVCLNTLIMASALAQVYIRWKKKKLEAGGTPNSFRDNVQPAEGCSVAQNDVHSDFTSGNSKGGNQFTANQAATGSIEMSCLIELCKGQDVVMPRSREMESIDYNGDHDALGPDELTGCGMKYPGTRPRTLSMKVQLVYISIHMHMCTNVRMYIRTYVPTSVQHIVLCSMKLSTNPSSTPSRIFALIPDSPAPSITPILL